VAAYGAENLPLAANEFRAAAETTTPIAITTWL